MRRAGVPPEVPGMSCREAGRSVFSESGACSAAVPAVLRSLPSLGLACGHKSVQRGLRTVSHQSPSPSTLCLPGGLPQASIPPTSTPGCPHMNPRAEGLCPALPAPVLVGSVSLGTRFSTPFCKVAPLQTPVPTSSLNNVLSNVPSFTKVSFTFY